MIFATGPGEGLKRVVLHEGPWLLAAVVVFFVVRAFLAEVFVIPSGSMIPTLLPRDRVIVVKPGGSGMPERWRIATFERSSVTYVKRAVGLGGDMDRCRPMAVARVEAPAMWLGSVLLHDRSAHQCVESAGVV